MSVKYPQLPCARCKATKDSWLLLPPCSEHRRLLLKSICIWSKQWGCEPGLRCPARRIIDCYFKIEKGCFSHEKERQVASRWLHLAAATEEVRTPKTRMGRRRGRAQFIALIWYQLLVYPKLENIPKAGPGSIQLHWCDYPSNHWDQFYHLSALCH